jgi:hypothetical protein
VFESSGSQEEGRVSYRKVSVYVRVEMIDQRAEVTWAARLGPDGPDREAAVGFGIDANTALERAQVLAMRQARGESIPATEMTARFHSEIESGA